MPDTRIDISVNEQGTATVTRALNEIASTVYDLSPGLAQSLRGLALRVGVSTDKTVRNVASAILEKVVKRTPVDTGQARGNWEVNIARTPPALTPHFIANQPNYADPTGDATIAAGQATISSKRQPGETIYISNALPYIQLLNQGTSSQAPAGFVQMAVQAGLKVASNAKILRNY